MKIKKIDSVLLSSFILLTLSANSFAGAFIPNSSTKEQNHAKAKMHHHHKSTQKHKAKPKQDADVTTNQQ